MCGGGEVVVGDVRLYVCVEGCVGVSGHECLFLILHVHL